MTSTVDHSEDKRLLERWATGDRSAGGQLYDRHVGAVARFFRNKLPEQTEEMVQATFLALVESHARIQDGVAIRAYLMTIARHKFLNYLRRKGGRPNFDAELHSVADVATSASEVVAKKREQRLLLEALRRIPVESQIALELFYWEDLNANEIAGVFGISHSAMRSRLSKARKQLEAALAELAASPTELESTLAGFDRWVEEIRGAM